MAEGFDVSEFDKFTKDMIDMAQKKMPKKLSKFMNTESRKLTAKSKLEAKAAVFKESGNYHKSIKKRKTYKKNGLYTGGTQSDDSKAHWLEYGHDQIVNPSKGKGGGRGKQKGRGIGTKVGVVAGRNAFKAAAESFEDEFNYDLSELVDDVAKELTK